MLLQSCGCGCTQSVTPQPPCNNKCRASLGSSSIAELVYLAGLDENLCDKFQRVVDVIGLLDCAGNHITIDTPLVTCADFANQLCAALVALEEGGEATPEVTLLVGADCKLYTLPPSGSPGSETPNTAVDTTTINMSATGTLGRAISGSVKISGDTDNIIEIHSDGLYAPATELPLTACQQIGNFASGGDAEPGTQLVGSDCLIYTFPAPEALTVTATDSIDLTLTGNNLSADLVLDPSTDLGVVTGSGLLITCEEVLACAPAVTVVDTQSVNLTLLGQQVSADVIISPDAFNALELHTNGLFVDVCTALNSGNLPVPAEIDDTVLVGADCNRYTLPVPTPIEVVDTSTVDLNFALNTLQADVLIQPNTLITTGVQGIQVLCEDVQDCIFNTNNNFWTYNDVGNSVSFDPSSDADNQIVLGTDGKPYVGAFGFDVEDTNCIDLAFVEGVLTATPIISVTAGNIIDCTEDGLFVPGVSIVAEASGQCIQVGVVESPANTYTISASPVISSSPGNALTCITDGLFVPTPDLAGEVCGPSTPKLFNLVLGSDALGNSEWQNPGRTDLTVGAATLNEINDATNRDTVFWATGNVTLPTPANQCSRYDIHIKNTSGSPITVSSGELIDGEGFITLAGTSVGAYPFGGDGGESVHLFYSFTDTTWRIL